MQPTDSLNELTQQIKQMALEAGFTAVGIADLAPIPDEVWTPFIVSVNSERYNGLPYLTRYDHLRRDPSQLIDGARSMIVVAQNYYPQIKQNEHLPQVAYYAYGRDYHKVVKKKLNALFNRIKEELLPDLEGRAFCDSAPIIETYWAQRAGLGWVGKSNLLVIPKAGTFHFIGTMIINQTLVYDEPYTRSHCGRCTRCIDACPTQALSAERTFDPSRCISYLTIEHHGEIPEELQLKMGNRWYGCDECQKACPHNLYAQPTSEEQFALRPILNELSYDSLHLINDERYAQLAFGSPMTRAGLEGLRRNAQIVINNQTDNKD